jgi:hypothetical protein
VGHGTACAAARGTMSAVMQLVRAAAGVAASEWPVAGVATALKLLLLPAYSSTDLEVHRNWLAITYNTAPQQWYYEATSKWTLDYPPLFAALQWCLAQLAARVDSDLVRVRRLPLRTL